MPFPSPEQREVIEHRGSPLIVVAGPGTGKTKTIVARMISLLLEDPSRNITFVTFTRTSRTDTLAKLNKDLPQGSLDQDDVVTPRVGTLHASASTIVHRLSGIVALSPNFSVLIADKGERDLVVEEVIDDLGLDVSSHSLSKAFLSYLRNLAVVEFPPLSEGKLLSAFGYFMELLRFYNALGMEEIVFTAVQILQQHPDRVPPIFLQVDEYQDLNPADQRLVNLVASNPLSEVVVVGDDAQSIYGFRDANFQGLRDLWEAPGWDSLTFPDCHRLPPHVQRAALALISEGDYLGNAMNPREDDGRRVLVLQCTRPQYQGIILARRIKAFLDQHTRDDGSPLRFSDVIVLCPSGKFVPGIRKALLNDQGIPSRDISRPEIPSHIWKIILILRLALHADNIAFRQWLEYVNIDSSAITEIRRAAMDQNTNIISFCEGGPNQQAQIVIAHAHDLREHSQTAPELTAKLADFPGLDLPQDAITEAVSYLLLEDGTLPPRAQWLGILYRKFGVLEDQSASEPHDAVLVTTLHSAKGLEAELVCVTWMNERYMPFPGRDPEEERRLLYVGMTRAKQELIIAFHELYEKGKGYLSIQALTPFLRAIGPYLSIERVAAKDLN
ncbi:MAG: ATP-dependent helicase [Planctomycetes bacterium]|nr:ATP-dependent helicase [Planctomycetota bacterium]